MPATEMCLAVLVPLFEVDQAFMAIQEAERTLPRGVWWRTHYSIFAFLQEGLVSVQIRRRETCAHRQPTPACPVRMDQ